MRRSLLPCFALGPGSGTVRQPRTRLAGGFARRNVVGDHARTTSSTTRLWSRTSTAVGTNVGLFRRSFKTSELLSLMRWRGGRLAVVPPGQWPRSSGRRKRVLVLEGGGAGFVCGSGVWSGSAGWSGRSRGEKGRFASASVRAAGSRRIPGWAGCVPARRCVARAVAAVHGPLCRRLFLPGWNVGRPGAAERAALLARDGRVPPTVRSGPPSGRRQVSVSFLRRSRQAERTCPEAASPLSPGPDGCRRAWQGLRRCSVSTPSHAPLSPPGRRLLPTSGPLNGRSPGFVDRRVCCGQPVCANSTRPACFISGASAGARPTLLTRTARSIASACPWLQGVGGLPGSHGLALEAGMARHVHGGALWTWPAMGWTSLSWSCQSQLRHPEHGTPRFVQSAAAARSPGICSTCITRPGISVSLATAMGVPRTRAERRLISPTAGPALRHPARIWSKRYYALEIPGSS